MSFEERIEKIDGLAAFFEAIYEEFPTPAYAKLLAELARERALEADRIGRRSGRRRR